MSLRQFFRETWDIAFLLIAIALILSWVLTITVILPLFMTFIPT